MNLAQAESIAKAVLYEGYMLYPYRPSSVKNRQRWTFGGIYPQAYSEAQAGTDPWSMQTQCLAQGNPQTKVTVRIGFLHLIEREVGELPQTLRAWPEDTEPEFRKLSLLEIGERRYYAWQEAVEREVVVGELSLSDLTARPLQIPFAFFGRRDLEPLRDQNGGIAGVLIRTQQPIEGRIEVTAEAVAEQVFRITVRIFNQTALNQAADLSRNAASLHALVSTHSILGICEGKFVSSLDPPEALRDAVNGCQNIGAWPVLVGAEGERDTMLCSPIILYDYPEIASESPGDLFDGTEIDEILTLRILAMTDEEKREMAAVDERARALLERTEALSPEALIKLHGTLRSLRPLESQAESDPPPWVALDSKPRLAYLRVGKVDLRVGDHVRLRPRAGADILDIALGGKTATIEAIERVIEDRVHVAVTVDDDPGREFGLERMPGHRFFFSPEELEPLTNKSQRAP
ncbi:MAG: hypothetical protein ACHBNF_15410 [Chromatiales bacterium]